MADYKFTYILNSQRAGWSESWYHQNEDLGSAIDKAVNFGRKRIGLLGQGSVLEAVRVSDVAVPGDAHIHKFTDQETKENSVAYGELTDTPWNAILCRVECGKDYRRSFHLRGVPDNAIEFNQTRQTWVAGREDFAKAFQSFMLSAKANGIAIRATSKEPAQAPLLNVNLVERFSLIEIKLTCAANHGLLQGDFVRVRNLRFGGVKVPSRSRVYIVPAPNTFHLQVKVPDGTDPLQPEKVTARKEVIRYPVITSLIIDRAAKKSTGRAFFSPVGRRKARK